MYETPEQVETEALALQEQCDQQLQEIRVLVDKIDRIELTVADLRRFNDNQTLIIEAYVAKHGRDITVEGLR